MLRNIVFMGSDAIALPLVDYLLTGGDSCFRLQAVVSQPDRPKGRGKKLQANPIAEFARQRGMQLFTPDKPGVELCHWVEDKGIDLVIVMAYGHIIRKRLLETPPLGCINLHASILPRYRGASPIETAIAAGETETGVSLMRMELAMDTGPVLDVERAPIVPSATGADMRAALAEASVPLMQRNIKGILAGTADFQAQDPQAVTYCRKLKKTDGQLDFNAAAKVLVSRINGLDPWPGCYCDFGATRLKLRCAGWLDEDVSQLPGTIVRADKSGVYITTGNGLLRVEQLQRPGAKMLPAQQFLQGFTLNVGDALTGAVMQPLVSDTQF